MGERGGVFLSASPVPDELHDPAFDVFIEIDANGGPALAMAIKKLRAGIKEAREATEDA